MAGSAIRSLFGYLFGIFISIFGVFLFSGFVYRGLSLRIHIIPLFQSIDTVWSGIYQIVSSGFMVNFFGEFSASNIAASSFWTILFGPYVWPTLISWFMAGFFIGVFFTGIKRSISRALVVYFFVILLWVVFGIFASADLTAIFQDNIRITLGELFTGLISILPGALLAGSLTKEA
jgi:hypothetical protein